MRFGPTPVEKAEGALLAHAIKRPGFALKKGERLGPDHIGALLAAGIAEIIVAEIEPGDVEENEAALRIARRLAGANLRLDAPFTGRCNLMAEASGVLVVNTPAVERINGVDESVTVATLPAFHRVRAGEMAATVKIIPFAIPSAVLERAVSSVGEAALRVAPFQALRVGVVSTLLPGLKASIVEKTFLRSGSASMELGAKSSPRNARGTRRAPSSARSAASKHQAISSSSLAPARSPIAATSSRRQSRNQAGASHISACRSIPAIFC